MYVCNPKTLMLLARKQTLMLRARKCITVECVRVNSSDVVDKSSSQRLTLLLVGKAIRKQAQTVCCPYGY
jgi:hypothetical protein